MFIQEAALSKHKTKDAIVFSDEGFAVVSEQAYSNSRINFTFNKPHMEIVLIPKYLSDTNYLFIQINSEDIVKVGAVIKGSEKIYNTLDIKDKVSEKNELVVTNSGSNFHIELNGKDIYKFQTALFPSGQVRVWGYAEEVIYNCTIEEPQSDSWKSNVVELGTEVKTETIENVRGYRLIGTPNFKAELSQEVPLTKGVYTVSFLTLGDVKCEVLVGDSVLKVDEFINDSLAEETLTFEIKSDELVTCVFSGQSGFVGRVQLEEGGIVTPYTENTSSETRSERENSTLSFPVKINTSFLSGSIYVAAEIFPLEGDKENLIVKTDDGQVSLRQSKEHIKLYIKGSEIQIPHEVRSQSKALHITASWDGNYASLRVNDQFEENDDTDILANTIKDLVFAEEESLHSPLILEEWALFNKLILKNEDVSKMLNESIMHSSFEGGISGENVTWHEIPVAPSDNSPILVQKDTGETLQKVSFFDYETGKYITFNKEPVLYDGMRKFLEVSFSNLDEEYRGISIETEEGEIIGEPYTIEGNRIYFSLTEQERRRLANKYLYARYQLKDSYTIDYNIKAVDGYRIDFAKHDGGTRVVYQEGNRHSEPYKLATMIDMNPIKNRNHEGFLFATNTINPTESFKITATPDRLLADGGSSSTLIVEPLDYQGNSITHANIRISAEQGTIVKHISKDAIETQKRSGQHLYEYHAPFIKANIDGEFIEDYIWIIDEDSSIGVGYKMLLRPAIEPAVKQTTNDELRLLEKKTEVANYILMYEGIEAYEDAELINILDLNEDGRVDMDDIVALSTGTKDQELTTLLNQMKEWEAKWNEHETT